MLVPMGFFDPSSPTAADSSQGADKCNFLVGLEKKVIVLTVQIPARFTL